MKPAPQWSSSVPNNKDILHSNVLVPQWRGERALWGLGGIQRLWSRRSFTKCPHWMWVIAKSVFESDKRGSKEIWGSSEQFVVGWKLDGLQNWIEIPKNQYISRGEGWEVVLWLLGGFWCKEEERRRDGEGEQQLSGLPLNQWKRETLPPLALHF